MEAEKRQLGILIEKPLYREGAEVVDLVLSRYRNNWTVRLFIFSERGTTIDECARISRIVGDLIDGTTLFESGYTLEVSSPGLERPLKTARDFRFRVGETVAIRFTDAAREKSTAEIVSATDRDVTFRGSAGEFSVDLSEIAEAKIVI